MLLKSAYSPCAEFLTTWWKIESVLEALNMSEVKNWKCFVRLNDDCIWTWIVDRHKYVLCLTWWPNNSKQRVFICFQISIQKVWNTLTASKYCEWKYKDSTYSKFVINIDRRYFNLKNCENENILPQQVYHAIKQIRQILIIHCSYIDCKPNRHKTLATSCCSNNYHVTY